MKEFMLNGEVIGLLILINDTLFSCIALFPYAKSSQLYVQDMMDLSSKMTADGYHKFTKCGYFIM
ncbi:hypothetical protein PR048_018067 [Dryococelus australis]|uniref:Uncharacterized protein n=1 Tax=Dryococelus australis TaxID=614101 RepID=A0ABQ9HBC4_9NEOP|nr:hypothetical protein PR048_018067 [Dryococelus australis]